MKQSPISSFILKHSLFIIILILLLSIFACTYLPKIKFDNSVDIFFNKKGDTYTHFQEWKDQFGSDDVIIIAFSDKDIFTKKNLALISMLSDKFESLKYVANVTSLTTVNNITGINNDFIVEKLIEEIPTGSKELKNIKKTALNNPIYLKNIISKDGKTTAILIELEHLKKRGDKYKKETLEDVNKILKGTPFSRKFYVSGLTTIEHYFASYMQDDLKTFMPFMIIIIFIILYLSFRNFKIVALTLVAIGISLNFTMAVLSLLGFSINNVTTIIPPILLAIVIADSIHLLTESIENKEKLKVSENKHSFLSYTMNHLFYPCFLTTLTTAVGFLSLTTSKIPPVKELGIVIGIGVFFALIVTFTFLPAAAKQFNILKNIKSKKTSKTLSSSLKKLGEFNIANKNSIIILSAILIGLSIWGITRIKAETSIIEFFKKDSPIYRATTFIEDKLSGVHPINISIRSNEYEYFKTPKALNAIEKLSDYLYTIPEIDKITSVNNYIKDINQSLHNEDPSFYKIPRSRQIISQYLLLYGRDDLDDFIDSKWQWTTVRVRLKEHSTIKLKKVIKKINDFLNANADEIPNAEVLGQTVLEVETNNTVTDGQLKSLLLAMMLIFCMMFLVFRSIPIGLISIIPNILPILVNFGIMGFLGIRLNSATSMIAAIGIGIVVDDTIHFLHSYEEGLKITKDPTDAVQYALENKGKPIIFTSIILFFGFGILTFSKFVPTSSFGLLSSILMINALLADLVILPCVLIKFQRHKGHNPN